MVTQPQGLYRHACQGLVAGKHHQSTTAQMLHDQSLDPFNTLIVERRQRFIE